MVLFKTLKVIIIFLLLITLCSSCFAVSVSELEGFYEVSNNVLLNDYTVKNDGSGFSPSTVSSVYYIKINKSSDYYVVSSPYAGFLFFTYSLEGTSTLLYERVPLFAGQEIYINSSYINNYNYMVFAYAVDNKVTVYNNSSPLNTTVNEVIDVLTFDNVLSILQKCVPLIVVVTLVALGYFIIRRLVKKSSKMKGGV